MPPPPPAAAPPCSCAAGAACGSGDGSRTSPLYMTPRRGGRGAPPLPLSGVTPSGVTAGLSSAFSTCSMDTRSRAERAISSVSGEARWLSPLASVPGEASTPTPAINPYPGASVAVAVAEALAGGGAVAVAVAVEVAGGAAAAVVPGIQGSGAVLRVTRRGGGVGFVTPGGGVGKPCGGGRSEGEAAPPRWLSPPRGGGEGRSDGVPPVDGRRRGVASQRGVWRGGAGAAVLTGVGSGIPSQGVSGAVLTPAGVCGALEGW
mmetsp:Transcript_28511/g.67265  ORF Transcript_28511/g.67265 Transcript_28511/m.67265 type:complete len:261 (+) Transcript_28511:92-874(+)